MNSYLFEYNYFTYSCNIPHYRNLFNGQEADNEVYGDGAVLGYEFRQYDARMGKFWSVDPLNAKFPWNSTYAFAENRVVDGMELEGTEAVLFVENEGVGHVFIGVFTDKGIRTYTYGRYMGSYFPSSGQFGPIGDAVLLKYDGAKAQAFIREHFRKGNSAKAYLIPSAKPDKIISYYENLLMNGNPLPKYIEKDGKTQDNPYYKYGKSIGVYSLIGRNCVTLSIQGLKEGDFDIKKEAFSQISPIGITSPSNVQLLIDAIMSVDASSGKNPRIYDSSKEIKEDAEKTYE